MQGRSPWLWLALAAALLLALAALAQGLADADAEPAQPVAAAEPEEDGPERHARRPLAPPDAVTEPAVESSATRTPHPSAAAPEAASIVPADVVRVRGRLVTESERVPLAGVRLRFRARSAEALGASTEHEELAPPEVLTDANGAFAIPGDWVPGDFTVVLAVEDEPPERRFLLAHPHGWLLEQDRGTVRELDLEARPPRLCLRVVPRQPDGTPVPDLVVQWGREARFTGPLGRDVFVWADERRTDATGVATFALWPDRREGARYRLRATDGERWIFGPVDLEAPFESGTVELPARPAATLEVLVSEESGVPVPDVSVSCGERRTTTDAGGLARFDGVQEGTWFVRASRWQTTTGTTIVLSSGDELRLDLTLPAVAAPVTLCAGRIVAESGQPVAGAHVRASHGPSTETRLDGFFELVGPPPDRNRTLVVYARHPGMVFEGPLRPSLGEIDLRIVGHARRIFGLVVRTADGRELRDAELLRTWSTGSESVRGGQVDRWSPGEPLYDLEADVHAAVVVAPGHRRRSVDPDALTASSPERPLVVVLEPGILREVVAPAGAEFFVDGERVATADKHGRATLNLDRWPRRVEVRAGAHATTDWYPMYDEHRTSPARISFPPKRPVQLRPQASD